MLVHKQNKAGGDYRHGHELSWEGRLEILRLHVGGGTTAQIAKETKRSRGCVTKIVAGSTTTHGTLDRVPQYQILVDVQVDILAGHQAVNPQCLREVGGRHSLAEVHRRHGDVIF